MDKTEAAFGYNSEASSEATAAKSSRVRTSAKIEIHPPKTSGDNIIQHFEMNLDESITLLKTYHMIEERNKKIHEDLESGKQATIAKLVQHLIQRRKDHETVSKCITILKKIKGEYEHVKREIAEAVKLQGKCLVEDKATQSVDGIAVCNSCGAIQMQRATSGCSTDTDGAAVANLMVDVLQKKPNAIDLQSARSNPDDNDDTDESIDEIPGTAVSQNMFATQGSQRRKSTNPRRHVTFAVDHNDENRTDSTEDGNDFKRVSITPTPVNLYANIMPRDPNLPSGIRLTPLNGAPIQSKNQIVQPLPFCIKKRFRTEFFKTEADLRQIYSVPGKLTLPKKDKVQDVGNSEPSEPGLREEAAEASSSAVAQPLVTKLRAVRVESLEDYTPIEIPQLRSTTRFWENSRFTDRTQGFSPQLSSRFKKSVHGVENGFSSRRRLNQKPKRLDLSLRGKPLVQTTLAFQNVVINDDSRSSSDSDSEKQKCIKLNTNELKYIPLVGNVR